jgi:hypothetical protein
MSDGVVEFSRKSGPGVGHRPRKNADASTSVSSAQFMSDDEVENLSALKVRLSEMLARPDISESDFKAISIEYRAVRVELKEAQDRAAARGLGKRAELKVVGGQSFDGDI